jgi:hypothetical protein
MGIRETWKSIAIGCGFLALITWNAMLQYRYDNKFRDHDENLKLQDDNLRERERMMKVRDRFG